MSVKYNNQFVDEKYSSILEPNLYYGSVFVPGVTFTDKYQTGPAGGIYVHKLSTSACDVGKPGRDFTNEETSDELIPILLNNNYQKSKKIYGVQAAACGIALANENLANAIKEAREGWQMSMLGCLVNEGKAATDTTVPTVDNIKEIIIKARQQIITAKGTANIVLCSPDFYSLILLSAGKDFTPSANDRINASGNVGVWLGFTFVECAGASAANAKYYDHTGTLKTVSLSGFDFAMYNWQTLSGVTNFETARLRDAEGFVGTLAQVEMNSGFRVTNNALTVIHKHTGSSG